MDTNKHTPGPWVFQKQANGSLDFFGENGKRVILCGARLINQEPNAHLIAAAPKLLENLIVILECLRLGYNANECVNEIENATAAILEAKNLKQ